MLDGRPRFFASLRMTLRNAQNISCGFLPPFPSWDCEMSFGKTHSILRRQPDLGPKPSPLGFDSPDPESVSLTLRSNVAFTKLASAALSLSGNVATNLAPSFRPRVSVVARLNSETRIIKDSAEATWPNIIPQDRLHVRNNSIDRRDREPSLRLRVAQHGLPLLAISQFRFCLFDPRFGTPRV